jgi:hypothetical protein
MTDEEKHDLVIRAVVQSTAAFILLDAAMALAAQEISAENYADVTKEVTVLMLQIDAPLEKLKAATEHTVEVCNQLCPPTGTKKLSVEQRAKMN